MSPQDIISQVDALRSEVTVRGGNDRDLCIVLFAYFHDDPSQRAPISAYLDALIGPVLQPDPPVAQSEQSAKGKQIRFQVGETRNGGKTVAVNPEDYDTIEKMLKGEHPSAATMNQIKDETFTFADSKELMYCSIHFEDAIFVLAVVRASDYIGINCYLTREGEVVDEFPVPQKRQTFSGVYDLCVNPQTEEELKPTHSIFVVRGSEEDGCPPKQ